jgi:hypothetical protein
MDGWKPTLGCSVTTRRTTGRAYLHLAEFAWNNHYHHSIKTTPFYANYGRHPVILQIDPPLEYTNSKEDPEDTGNPKGN